MKKNTPLCSETLSLDLFAPVTRKKNSGKRYDISDDVLKSLYLDDLLSLDEIAVRLSMTKRTVANRLIRFGVERRPYTERHKARQKARLVSYFSDWQNQSPYILGYIFADGSIDVLNPKSKGVSLQCVYKDRKLIDDIAREIGLAEQVKTRIRDGQPYRRVLRFYGNAVVELMAEYGILPRKTWINYPLPAIPDEKMCHFLRGVFDGDGWVSFSKGHFSAGFLGPELFVTDIRDFLTERLGLPRMKVQSRPGHYAVAYANRDALRRLYDFLYPSGDYIYLERKRTLLAEIINWRK